MFRRFRREGGDEAQGRLVVGEYPNLDGTALEFLRHALRLQEVKWLRRAISAIKPVGKKQGSYREIFQRYSAHQRGRYFAGFEASASRWMAPGRDRIGRTV